MNIGKYQSRKKLLNKQSFSWLGFSNRIKFFVQPRTSSVVAVAKVFPMTKLNICESCIYFPDTSAGRPSTVLRACQSSGSGLTISLPRRRRGGKRLDSVNHSSCCERPKVIVWLLSCLLKLSYSVRLTTYECSVHWLCRSGFWPI